MRRFLPLLLCLSVSVFALARAMKPAECIVSGTQSARQSAMKHQADANTFLKHPITEQEPGSNDNNNDSTQDGSGNEGEEATNDDGDAAADENTGDEDAADNDAGDDGDDSGSDDGGQ